MVLHDSIFVLFIPRGAEVVEECRALQVEVGLAGTAVDDSPLPFQDKVRNARRENVPFIVLVEGGEKTLRTLGVIRQDGRQVWMSVERLAEAVRRESETPPKEVPVTVPGSSESMILRNLPALCAEHIRKLGEIYRSNLLAPDRARAFELALSGTDRCPACFARRNEQEPKPRRMRAKVLVVGEPDVRGSSMLRRFVLDAFDEEYIQVLGVKVWKKLMRPQVDGERISLDLTLWDIRGQKASEMIKEAYFYGTQGILFVCDGSKPASLLALTEWTEAIQKVTGRIPVTILVNKTRRRSGRGLEEPAVAEAAKPSEAAYYFFSSSHDDQVEEALKNLGTRIARERWHKPRPDAY